MNSITPNHIDFSRLTVAEYRELTKHCPPYDPNPFLPHPDGPWHERVFPVVVNSVSNLLSRYDCGLVSEQHLLRGKDNDKRHGPNGHPLCHDTLSYWLYYQHHKGDERDKLLGQRYWSVAAVESWHAEYATIDERFRISGRGGRYGRKTFPKREAGGLRSEHVVPKNVMKRLLIGTRDRKEIHSLLELNLCCVVTRAEDRRLERDSHPSPHEPWSRYRDKGIILAHNPAWSDAEIEPLLRNGLLTERSFRLIPR